MIGEYRHWSDAEVHVTIIDVNITHASINTHSDTVFFLSYDSQIVRAEENLKLS